MEELSEVSIKVTSHADVLMARHASHQRGNLRKASSSKAQSLLFLFAKGFYEPVVKPSCQLAVSEWDVSIFVRSVTLSVFPQ